MKTISPLALLVLLPFVSCASAGDAPGADSGAVPFESLANAQQSGLLEAEKSVLRTPQAWQEAWDRINAFRLPAPPLPEVDFDHDMVVLVALGTKTTVGYRVRVFAVERDGAFLRVHARVETPAPDLLEPDVLTHPFHAVRVPRSEGPVDVVLE